MSKTVCLFSCGAASAVATKIALKQYDNVEIWNSFVAEEHPDNRRFLTDCEKWFGQEVKIWKNEKFDGSIYNVFKHRKFIKGPHGTQCTRYLKRGMNKAIDFKDGDIMVVGFTYEEKERFHRLKHGVGVNIKADIKIVAPLIDFGFTKQRCIDTLVDAGVEMPVMYKLGYSNANCIGCVKGGLGYWNKIRVDFPEVFQRMADFEKEIGATVLQTRDGAKRPLRYLDKEVGTFKQNIDTGSCGFFCAADESEEEV